MTLHSAKPATRIHRRTMLKSAGVALALPALESMDCAAHAAIASSDAPQRMITICTTLGLHAPSLFPKTTGADFEITRYLKPLQDHRSEFTLFSGLSHPDQAGADGHSSQMTWLTSARHPGLGGFRNSISVDQFAREKIGYATRFPSLALSSSGTTSQSYTRGGVMIPAESRPSRLFQKMFLQGKKSDIQRRRQQLSDGQSILDSLIDQARLLKNQITPADRIRLEEYFTSIRATENQFAKANEWLDKPRPKVDADVPQDIANDSDVVGRMKLLMELIPLIIQTDSSRVISVVVHGRNDVPPVPGVSVDHHNLSHHGKDETKIEQLQKIESELMSNFGRLLTTMKSKSEGDRSLLDNTMVLFGSNLGNANSHDWRNLPVIMAGGNFNHGRYIAYDKDNNIPLSNLFVSMLQKMKFETDRFGTSTRRLDW